MNPHEQTAFTINKQQPCVLIYKHRSTLVVRVCNEESGEAKESKKRIKSG